MPVDNSGQVMETIGSYDLTDKIAEGGMGTVYKGRHRLTGETVAVKVMPKHLLNNPIYLKRFEQEYTAARTLDHPNIVRALDFGREAGTPYLVMEFVAGESLGQRLERDGRLPEDEAVEIVSQVAKGLHKAHLLGLIHRDVKPDNILLTADGQAKLTDLGLVKELDADLNLTRTGRGLGTPHFMAPEQFRNAKKADARCDIYSLAATLYMMVTGELPFRANGPLDAWMRKINNEIAAPRALVPDISERLDWAIRRAMSPNPLHRPENCREFIEDLNGQGTRRLSDTETTLTGGALWYLIYQDNGGVEHKVKGTTVGVRRSLQDGALGEPSAVRLASSEQSPLERLEHFVEFRDLASAAALLIPPSPPAPTTPTLPAPAAVAASGPHIPLNAVGPRSLPEEFWKWLALLTIALAAGTVGYLFMPLLRWRWLW
jgi:eukaryotic-like serine/threonine-protein kinase